MTTLTAPTKEQTARDAGVNVDLMIWVYAYIRTHKEEWFQGAWRRCRTAFCFAGHVSAQSGLKWAVPFPFKFENQGAYGAFIGTRWSGGMTKEQRELLNVWENHSAYVVRTRDLMRLDYETIELPSGKTMNVVYVPLAAEKILGARRYFNPRTQVWYDLFGGDNSLADIRKIIGWLCGITQTEVTNRAMEVANQEGWVEAK